jgi:hypothetical protein
MEDKQTRFKLGDTVFIIVSGKPVKAIIGAINESFSFYEINDLRPKDFFNFVPKETNLTYLVFYFDQEGEIVNANMSEEYVFNSLEHAANCFKNSYEDPEKW